MDNQADLLGPLLLEQNLLVPEQLDLALQFAERTGLPLDRIVVAEFAVPQPDIARLLAEVDGASASEESDAEPVASAPVRPLGFRIRRPIGQIFVDLGFITPDDREAALEVQRESGGLLGEILIEQGKLTRLELANALSEHWESNASETAAAAPEKPSLVVVPDPSDGGSSLDASALADLRRSLDELEAARVADAQSAAERITAIDEAIAALGERDDEEFRQATTERFEELVMKIESVEIASTGAVDLDSRLHALAGSTFELRSDLEELASRQAEAEPSETVHELEQTLTALAQTMDDRLETLTAELRAETTSRTDDTSAELRARIDELATSIAALREKVDGSHAESSRDGGTRADESRALTARVDELNDSREADAQAAKRANDQLHEKLDELIALRATDLAATEAAQAQAAQAAAEATRIEHALRSELEARATRQGDQEPGETTAGQLRERVDELIALRAADLEATQAAQKQAAAETANIEHALRSELEALASRRAEAEPGEAVSELRQTLDVLAQTMDERLATLAAELRADTASRTDDISAQLHVQTDDLAASIAALRDTIAAGHAEASTTADAWPDEARALTARIDELNESREADAQAATHANDQLHEKLDELLALRAADLETTHAAQKEVAAETTRIEHSLVGALAELAVQVDDLEHQRAGSLVSDDEQSADASNARGPKVKKGSKRGKGKKRPKH